MLSACLSSSLGVLLKYNRIIQNKNRKRNFTKKKRIEKKQNTNKYCSFQRFGKLLLVRTKLGGGFRTWPPSKKKASPPALMINYITCRCLCCFPCWLLCCLCPLVACCLTSLFLAGCVAALVCRSLTNLLIAPNNPFNTLIIAYITFDSIIIPIL